MSNEIGQSGRPVYPINPNWNDDIARMTTPEVNQYARDLRKRLEARDAEIERLREALEPFAAWAKHHLDNLPARIAEDDTTPVLGDIWAKKKEPEVTVGDLKIAAAIRGGKP